MRLRLPHCALVRGVGPVLFDSRSSERASPGRSSRAHKIKSDSSPTQSQRVLLSVLNSGSCGLCGRALQRSHCNCSFPPRLDGGSSGFASSTWSRVQESFDWLQAPASRKSSITTGGTVGAAAPGFLLLQQEQPMARISHPAGSNACAVSRTLAN